MNNRIKDAKMVGNRYGNLVITKFAYIRNNRSYWECLCDCGETTIRRTDGLKENSSCPKCKG